MANLHNEYIKFNKEIRLTESRKEKLKISRKVIKQKIKDYFKDKKNNELQPKFWGQGSFEMDTTINPIPEYDQDDNKLLKYDLDYGVYFIEKDFEDNQRGIQTWHDWVYNAVENHTDKKPKKKTTCVRVLFSDGHHIDLPIYYKNGNIPELAHKSKGWIKSDPKEFYEWFNKKANKQLKRIVRYLKAWRNFRETKNTNLSLPSGFILTILATNNYISNDSDDISFFKTIESIKDELNDSFECYRPTQPTDEDLFEEYSETKKNNFLDALDSLIKDCNNADNENNFKTASEYLQNHFGGRFPIGEDKDEKSKNDELGAALSASTIKPKPYAKG